MPPKKQPESVGGSATLSIPELGQSKTAVLNTLASQHSRRSYEHAIGRFSARYCSDLEANLSPVFLFTNLLVLSANSDRLFESVTEQENC